MRVIGIDPGSSVTGYGVVDVSPHGRLSYIASGAISTSSRTPLAHRLKTIYDELMTVFRAYRPGAVVIEDTFLAKNFQAALKLGQARGMALLAAQMCNVPIYEYTPTQVKMAVVGYGVAQKDQVQKMVERLLYPSDKMKSDFSSPSGGSHHATDALACAICHLHSIKIQSAIGQAGSRTL